MIFPDFSSLFKISRFSSPCIYILYLFRCHSFSIYLCHFHRCHLFFHLLIATFYLVFDISTPRLNDIIHSKTDTCLDSSILCAQICLHTLTYGMGKSKYILMEILPSVLPVHNLLIQFLIKQTISNFGSVRSNSHFQRSRTGTRSEFCDLNLNCSV